MYYFKKDKIIFVPWTILAKIITKFYIQNPYA